MRYKFLAGVGHQSRAIIVMVGALVFYCVWLWLLTQTGVIDGTTSSYGFGLLLLLPLLPIAAIDLWLRLTWEPELPTLYPPPPTHAERLLQREYGLYWFPVLICIPLWMWFAGLTGWLMLNCMGT
ncbi:MAG: hypothetical protein Q8M11_22230 [Sulfuritalea sp.]|nr:hypothetical protein [Sulfuritalea sp.]